MQCAPPEPRTAADLLRDRNRAKVMAAGPAGPASNGWSHTSRAALPHATLSEVFAGRAVNPAADGAVTGFVAGHLTAEKPVLWIMDRLSRREAGVPYLTGLRLTAPVMRLDLSHPRDVLWAAEQALECGALQAVVADIWGDPAVLDFTATKRLALRAEAYDIPCWLVRRGGTAALSAARERWRVSSLASLRHPYDGRAPGDPLWQAELFRSRFRPPQAWVARHDPEHGVVLDHGVSEGGAAGPTRTARTG